MWWKCIWNYRNTRSHDDCILAHSFFFSIVCFETLRRCIDVLKDLVWEVIWTKFYKHILFHVYYVICTEQCHSCFVMIFWRISYEILSRKLLLWGCREVVHLQMLVFFLQQLLTQISVFQMQKVVQIKTN